MSSFLSEEQLFNFYKKNKLHFSYSPKIEEISDYFDQTYSINGSKILLNQYNNKSEEESYSIRYENSNIVDFIKNDLFNNNSYHKILSTTLYPEWLLFYISINKYESLRFFKNDFNKYIELFKYIAQIRYKKYVKLHVDRYVNNFENLNDFKKKLNNEFLIFLKSFERGEDELFDFLYFLNILRRTYKDIEKYKLMWNIETYIREVISLLLDKYIPTEKIYKKLGEGTYSELHEVHLLKDLYIEESKNHFQKIFLPKIKKLFSEATFERVMNYLAYNKKYENITLSYLEVIKYLNANKPNELVLGAMVRNMVLELEEIVKNKDNLATALDSIAFDKDLFIAKRKKHNVLKTGREYLDEVIEYTHEKESFEYNLLIYHAIRNYLAHHNLVMDNFFGVMKEK